MMGQLYKKLLKIQLLPDSHYLIIILLETHRFIVLGYSWAVEFHVCDD